MSPPGSRDGFEEDLSDLIELNGYDVVKISRSDDGGSEIIAAKTDEVGHKVDYLIHCRRSEAPIDDAEVEGIAKAPGEVSWKHLRDSLALVRIFEVCSGPGRTARGEAVGPG